MDKTMRKIPLLLMAILPWLCPRVHAQVWCPSGARWVYDTGSPWAESWTQFTYVGDTLMDGILAQHIENTGFISQLFGNDTLIQTSGPDVITRTVPGSVLEWSAGMAEWDTLYWFDAVPGDSWIPAWAFSGECPEGHRLVVLDTGTVVIDGVELRSMDVQRSTDDQPTGPIETVFERIGNTQGFFQWVPDCGGALECYCTFGCYSDQTLSYPAAGSACGLPVSISVNTEKGAAIDVYPNPGMDVLHITTTGKGLAVVRVTDTSGRDMAQLALTTQTIALSTLQWPPGVYVVEVTTSEALSTVKWIKQ